MKYLVFTATILVSLVYAPMIQAASVSASGKISVIRFYGSGMILVFGLTFDGQTDISHCAGTQSGFLIPSDYAKMDRLLSLLLTTKATELSLTVHNLEVGTSCWAPTFVNSSYVDFD